MTEERGGPAVADFWFWPAALVAAVLVGLSKGGLPVVATMSVPLLALVMNPVAAAGLLLPVYVVSDIFGLYAYRHSFDRRVLAIVVPAALIGIVAGWATASRVPERWVTLLVGVIGASFALNFLLRHQIDGPPRRARLAPGLFWGAISGFTSFVSHSGAPPFQAYVLPLRLDKLTFAGTATIAFAIINAVKLIPYWFLGQLSAENLRHAAILLAPASAAVFLGRWLVRILPRRQFFRLVIWALLVLSAKLIRDGLAG